MTNPWTAEEISRVRARIKDILHDGGGRQWCGCSEGDLMGVYEDTLADVTEGLVRFVAEQLAERTAERDTYRAALTDIAEGKGRYSRDPMEHAVNTIEDLKRTATEALAGKS